MNCKNCGKPLQADALFCEECGTRVEKFEDDKKMFCGNCGSIIGVSDEFCAVCGTKTGVSAAPAATTPAPAEPPVTYEPPVAQSEPVATAEQPGVYCKRCGIELFKEDTVCPSCGKKVDEFGVEETVRMGSDDADRFYQMYTKPDNVGPTTEVIPPTTSSLKMSPKKKAKSGNSGMIIAIVISVVVLLLAAGVIVLILTGGLGGSSDSSDASPTEIVTEEVRIPSDDDDDDEDEDDERPARGPVTEEETDRPSRRDDDEDEEEPTRRPLRPVDSDDDYLFDSDTKYITTSYLDRCTQDEVRLILNEMYARHGYIFKDASYYAYFSQKSWYNPRYESQEDAQRQFNSYEEANRITIIDYEESMGWR